MTNFAIFGIGLMGEAILYDLLQFYDDGKILCFETNKDRTNEIKQKYNAYSSRLIFENTKLQINDEPDNYIITSLKDNKVKVVFGAIDYKFNYYLSKICLEVPCHFLDLGGNPEVVAQQKSLSQLAINKDITIIPDCGLAPGMANVLAANLMNSFDELDECHIRVGGLPQNPEGILNYQQIFSIRGLTNEDIEDAIIIRDGQLTRIESLTEVEKLHFNPPYDNLEAFHTAGGTSSMPELYKGKINDLTYKTIRYEGHVQFFQFLDEYELLSSEPFPLSNQITPREVIEFYLSKNLPKSQPDVVLVRVIVCGELDGQYQTRILELIDEFDPITGFSAMARTTAYPISIIGQLIARGEISNRGVVPGEVVVPYQKFVEELGKRNITITITSN